MKKILIIALFVLCVILMISACGNHETENTFTEELNQSTKETTIVIITETESTEIITTPPYSPETTNTETETDIPIETDLPDNHFVSLDDNTTLKDYYGNTIKLNKIYNNPITNVVYTKRDSNYFENISKTENKIYLKESPDISNLDSVSACMDYCVFYSLESAEIYVGNSSLSDVKKSLNKAFWNSLLMPSNVGYYIDASGIKDSKIIIHFLYNESTNLYVNTTDPRYKPITIPYSYSGNKRDADNTYFPYMLYSYQKLDVSNSEQLLYAFQNGYVPNIIEGSDAEILYNRAVEILNKIISNDMTDNEKMLAITSYLHCHCTYDFESDDYAIYTSSSLSSYPAYVATSFVSFHAEGPLLYGQGVCQGFAKAYAILLGIEGIKCYKVTTVAELVNSENTINPVSTENRYDEHGYLYVKNNEDGKYYILDPTYNYGINVMGLQSSRAFALLISYKDWSKVYSNQRPDSFCAKNESNLGTESYNWYKDFKFEYNGKTYSMFIDDDTDAKEFKTALINYLMNFDEEFKVSNNSYIIQINANTREKIDEIDREITGDTSSYSCLPFFAYYGTDLGATCLIFFR